MKAIIPCAGFGTRMGMTPNLSKEMIIDPNTIEPIINYSLNLCKKYDLEPILISRSKKVELNEYLMDLGYLLVINDTPGEWMDSVLASKNHWTEHNILILPDTRFEPIEIIPHIKQTLELGAKCVLGLHKVENVSLWGSIENYSVIEKNPIKKEGFAWGLIGFNKNYGDFLFKSMKLKGTNILLNNTSFIYLDKFTDITRNKLLQKY